MSYRLNTSELYPAIVANLACGPLTLASAVSLACPSTPGHTHPVRALDVAGVPDFFDHAGNFVNGNVPASIVIYAGIAVSMSVHKGSKRQRIIATSVMAAATSTGVNVAYEAGVPMGILRKPPEAPFDGQDALYGSAAGLLTAGVFCIAALRSTRIRANKRAARAKG